MKTSKVADIAFFDLDYTIVPHDTLFLFTSYMLRKNWYRVYYLLFLIPAMSLYLIGLGSPQILKRAFLSILAGATSHQVGEWSDDFSTRLLELTYPEIIAEIKRHKKNKTKLVLNTASPVFYIEPFGKKLGFDVCIGSKFEITPIMPLFPRAIGKNNKNFVKLENMSDMIDPGILKAVHNDQKDVYIPNSDSYSDSTADLPLLWLAQRKHVVNPGKNLARIAQNHSWKIWHPAKPFRSKAGKLFLSFSQMLGLYKV